MSEFSDYLEAEILDHIFVDGGLAQPDTYIALFTDNPGEDASGTEVSGGSYARKLFSDWTRSTNTVSNNSAITFVESTGSWGTVTHVAIFDAITAGNMLCYTALDSSQAVASGQIARFAAGELTISLD